ncbi:MAG: TetR/AcrR family transcriptional regulator [Tepidiformaceae bacterium]
MTIPPAVFADTSEPLDGRRAWRDRNRLAVVDALLDLYAEGSLRPDAQAVAERSGVSKRSVFRYFDDRDDLDRAAIERQQARVHHLVELPAIGQGELEHRIAAICEQRVKLFQQIHPAARVSRLRAPFHTVIAEELEQSRQFFTRQVVRQFALELEGMDESRRNETLAAADALSSFETYDFLRGRGYDPGQVQGAMQRGLAGLLQKP